MSRETIVVLKDDLDGSEASESVRFTVRGTEYEIDLSERNAAAFDRALEKWVGAARTTSSRARGRRRTSGSKVDARAVRAWAAENGVSVSERGRIPASVVEQFMAAS
jgi:hypothetical protein